MSFEFTDMECKTNPRNGSRIDTADDFFELLNGMARRPPFFFELRGEYTLQVGLGKDKATVQFCPSSGDPPYMLAVAPGRPERLTGASNYAQAAREDNEADLPQPEYLCGSTATPVPTRDCIPLPLMKTIIVHFIKTGERLPDVLWDEI